MKLLICTQAVDEQDSNLGFFVRWIEEFAKHCERVEVICLRAGTYTLPPNVQVHSLHSRHKVGRTLELWRLSMVLDYDTVFVHMNPEYLAVAGWLWRLFGKRTALWYTHKSVTIRLRYATLFTDVILTASKESFRLPSAKLHIMGHGIDTDFFTPDPSVLRGSWALSIGRLSKSKRHDVAIEQAARAGVELRIIGDGPEHKNLEEIARTATTPVHFLGGMTQTQLRDEYRRSAYFIHTSETGSLDKVVLEALACGLQIKTNDPALKILENEGPEYVRAHHSLQKLIPAILTVLA